MGCLNGEPLPVRAEAAGCGLPEWGAVAEESSAEAGCYLIYPYRVRTSCIRVV